LGTSSCSRSARHPVTVHPVAQRWGSYKIIRSNPVLLSLYHTLPLCFASHARTLLGDVSSTQECMHEPAPPKDLSLTPGHKIAAWVDALEAQQFLTLATPCKSRLHTSNPAIVRQEKADAKACSVRSRPLTSHSYVIKSIT